MSNRALDDIETLDVSPPISFLQPVPFSLKVTILVHLPRSLDTRHTATCAISTIMPTTLIC